jgi:thiamine-monophosphate kinase
MEPSGDPWSEDALHRWLAEQPWPTSLVGSRGHDAAVIGEVDGQSVLCADQCIENVHFVVAAGGQAVGRKAVLRTLSDLAATAARPVAVTLTLSAPPTLPGQHAAAWIQSALTGANAAASEHGAELVAGDLAQSVGPVAISVTALGYVPRNMEPVGRDRAAAGQAILLSGPVGGSLPSGRHLEPSPRVQAGIDVAAAGATALMDVSDGLAWDLYRMARASKLNAILAVNTIPLHADAVQAAQHSGRTALDHALHDGEDHELIASMPPDAWTRFQQSAPGASWHKVGTFQTLAQPSAHLTLTSPTETTPWLPAPGRGWTHTPT